MVVDRIIMTNAGGRFIKTGGTLVQKTSPQFDLNLDADRDGQSNFNELTAGTDPFDPSSSFRLLSAEIIGGKDVRLVWTAGAGHNYVVQVATNLTGNQAIFRDLSPTVSVAIGETQASYVHFGAGASTNQAGFYRIRLEP